MILVISGTNRPGANTLKVAREAHARLEASGVDARLLDLSQMPREIFDSSSYASKPEAFAPFQQAVLEAEGIVIVTPEYNGSFPGVLKYFIDMLKFPESLYMTPVAFIGLSAGPTGAMRPIEQLTHIFQYRKAHVYGDRVLMPGIHGLLTEDGRIADEDLSGRLDRLLVGFTAFAQSVRQAQGGGSA